MNYISPLLGSVGIDGTLSSDWIFAAGDPFLLTGGAAKDVFAIQPSAAPKYILDFQDGSDLIDLSALGVERFDDIEIRYHAPENKAIVTLESGQTIFLHASDPSVMPDLDASDFLYSGTVVHDYDDSVGSVFVSQLQSAVHLGNGGESFLNLKALVRGVQTAEGGATIVMDDDVQNNGNFSVRGITQHFFNFKNVLGTTSRDAITGSADDNIIIGLANSDTIRGGDGDDVIFGDNGTDRLYGDAGDDVITGGKGYDLLRGGEGRDVFVFVSFDNRKDVVFDYEEGIDRLDISQWGVSSVDDLEITELRGGRLRVDLPDGGLAFELRAAGERLSAADLDDGDFIFV